MNRRHFIKTLPTILPLTEFLSNGRDYRYLGFMEEDFYRILPGFTYFSFNDFFNEFIAYEKQILIPGSEIGDRPLEAEIVWNFTTLGRVGLFNFIRPKENEMRFSYESKTNDKFADYLFTAKNPLGTYQEIPFDDLEEVSLKLRGGEISWDINEGLIQSNEFLNGKEEIFKFNSVLLYNRLHNYCFAKEGDTETTDSNKG